MTGEIYLFLQEIIFIWFIPEYNFYSIIQTLLLLLSDLF